MSSSSEKSKRFSFVHLGQSQDGAKHSIGIDPQGVPYSWGGSNSMGQLGRSTGKTSTPHKVSIGDSSALRGYAGGFLESGHSAILDSTRTRLYVAGCDRWQQLGLGSSSGGASGYTWADGGRIWRNEFILNTYLQEAMLSASGSTAIRDVALGGDHTVVLSANQRDVYTFGKGGEGQLGVTGKPFVCAPAKSTTLSSKKRNETIAAVCAIQYCSLTLDEQGNILNEAGKCRKTESLKQSLQVCRLRAEKDGLLQAKT